MKDNKMIRRRQFYIWNYDEEIEYLNKLSEEGWHLVYKKPLHKEFIKDTQVSYKYQIDYNDNSNDKERYFEIFREQGWEKIDSKYGERYYFRKKYDESLPEEEYQIYTDKETKKEMFSGWLKVMNLISIINILAAIIRFASLSIAIATHNDILDEVSNLVFVICITGLLQSGCINIKRVTSGKKKLPKLIPVLFFLFAIISWIVLVYDFWMHLNGY